MDIPFLESTDHFLSFETLFDYPPTKLIFFFIYSGLLKWAIFKHIMYVNYKESTQTTKIFGINNPKIGNLGVCIVILGKKVI